MTFRGSLAKPQSNPGMFAILAERRKRLAAYRAKRARLEAMSEADLADIGIKRYQLGAIARAMTLR